MTRENDYLAGRTHTPPQTSRTGFQLFPLPPLDRATLRRMTDPIENVRAAARAYARRGQPAGLPVDEAVRRLSENMARFQGADTFLFIPRYWELTQAADLARRLGLSADPSARPMRLPLRGGWPATPRGGYVWPRRFRAAVPRTVPVGHGSNHLGPSAVDLGPATPRTRMAIKHWALRQRDETRNLLQRYRSRRRGRAMHAALDGIEWDWPPKETRWKPRRIFDHEKDRWEW